MTAYPVSVRNVIDKSMEIEVLLQYYIFWQDTSVDAGTELDDVWKPSIYIQDAVKVDWIVQDKVKYTKTDKIQKQTTGLGLTNMKLSGRAKFIVTNRGDWSMGDFPFDSRTLSLVVANMDPVFTNLVPFYYEGFTKSMTGKLPSIWTPTTEMQLLAQYDGEIEGSTDTVMKLQFSAKRNGWIYVETCMFPVCCCFMVAYFGFFVPITVRMPRFATAIISFLTTASLKRAIEAKIPTGAVDCFLEKWLTFQMALLMLCCIMHMVAYNVHEFRKVRKAKKLLKAGRTTHTPDVDVPLRFALPVFFLMTFVQARLASLGTHTGEALAYLSLLLWIVPLTCSKGLMKRCGCLCCLLGYDEEGKILSLADTTTV